jgi:ankyrin repeat protein
LPWLASWKFAIPIGLNDKDNDGWTVLTHAAHNGHIAVLSLLLKHS